MKVALDILFALLFVSCLQANRQSSDATLKTISPFDSLSITEVNVIGNKKTMQVIISLEIKNNYIKEAELILSLSAFADFGMTDDKDIKYKACISGVLGGTHDMRGATSAVFPPVSNVCRFCTFGYE